MHAALSPTEAMQALGLSLLSRQFARDEHVSRVISPLSLYSALHLLSGGAGGTPLKTLNAKLGLRAGTLGVQPRVRDQDEDVDEPPAGMPGDHTELRSANAVFLDGALTLAPAYAEHAARLGAKVAVVPSLPAAAGEINAYVSQQTAGRIRSLVAEAELARAHVVLVNALSFRGRWANGREFEPENTAPHQFTSADGRQRSVDMMWAYGASCMAQAADQYTALWIPFRHPGRTASDQPHFVAMLPAPGRALGALLAHLSETGLPRLQNATWHKLDLGLPHGEVETTSALREDLAALGYPVNEPLPHMCNEDATAVDDIRHKVVLKWDEEGAEGAAATVTALFGASRTPPTRLVFDRPFVFGIVTGDGAPAFLGVYA